MSYDNEVSFFPSGTGASLSLDSTMVLWEVRNAVPNPPTRPCPTCDGTTSQVEGPCDPCTGELRTVCRACLTHSPGADWSEGESPTAHRVPAGVHAGKLCPGMALSVTILE